MYLSRQSKAKKMNTVNEEDVKKKTIITPEDVLLLDGPTDSYLCDYEANVYDIDFTRFRVRDIDSNHTLFDVQKSTAKDDKPSRFVKYLFPPQFLELRTLGATYVDKQIEFTIGSDQPVNEFRMVERHFFKKKCLKSFEFNFGFCMPLSTNTCEHIYSMPELSAQEKRDLISFPYETKSDSFYFVNGQLIMHHKAEYAYNAINNSQ